MSRSSVTDAQHLDTRGSRLAALLMRPRRPCVQIAARPDACPGRAAFLVLWPERLDAACARCAVVAHRLLEGLDDRRVELRAGVGAQLVERLGRAAAAAVGPVGDHRVERVADRDDAGAERDLLAREAVGVAAAVPALVREAHERRELAQALDGLEDPAPISGCARMCSRSPESSGPRLRRSSDGMPILPMSCSTAACSTSRSAAGVEAEHATDAARKVGDRERVARRVQSCASSARTSASMVARKLVSSSLAMRWPSSASAACSAMPSSRASSAVANGAPVSRKRLSVPT